MQLMYSPTSPFVRKVLVCAIVRDLDRHIERVIVDAQAPQADFVSLAPLSKIPVLVTDDDVVLYDSPVICEYLDSLGDAPALLPASGAARWRALTVQALADGMMDAAVLRRGESLRPAEAARDQVMTRQHVAIERALDALALNVPHRVLDIGTIALACALGYLDFRFSHEPWRPARPQLTKWFDAMHVHPALSLTIPSTSSA